MSATKEYYHDEIEKQTRIMNKTEMMYKADTGNNAKVGFEFERTRGWSTQIVFSEKELKAHFDLSEDIIELYSPEYIKWLEEKVETMQKLPANNI